MGWTQPGGSLPRKMLSFPWVYDHLQSEVSHSGQGPSESNTHSLFHSSSLSIAPPVAPLCDSWWWQKQVPREICPLAWLGMVSGLRQGISIETGWWDSFTKWCGNYPEICQISNVFIWKWRLLLPHVVGVKKYFPGWKSAPDFKIFEDKRFISTPLRWLPISGALAITGSRCSGKAHSAGLGRENTGQATAPPFDYEMIQSILKPPCSKIILHLPQGRLFYAVWQLSEHVAFEVIASEFISLLCCVNLGKLVNYPVPLSPHL